MLCLDGVSDVDERRFFSGGVRLDGVASALESLSKASLSPTVESLSVEPERCWLELRVGVKVNVGVRSLSASAATSAAAAMASRPIFLVLKK